MRRVRAERRQRERRVAGLPCLRRRTGAHGQREPLDGLARPASEREARLAPHVGARQAPPVSGQTSASASDPRPPSTGAEVGSGRLGSVGASAATVDAVGGWG